MSSIPKPFGLPVEESVVAYPYIDEKVVSIYVPENCDEYELNFIVDSMWYGLSRTSLRNQLAPLSKVCIDHLLAESRDIPSKSAGLFIYDALPGLSYGDESATNDWSDIGHTGEDYDSWEEPENIGPKVQTLTGQTFIRQHPADYLECLVDGVRTTFVRNQPFRLAREGYLNFLICNGEALRTYSREEYILNPKLSNISADFLREHRNGGIRESNVLLYGVLNHSDLIHMDPITSADEIEIDKNLMLGNHATFIVAPDVRDAN